MTDVGGYEPADIVRQVRQGVFRGSGDVGSVGARIQDRWRPENAAAERELIGQGVRGLAVEFPEAQVGLDDIAIRQIAIGSTIGPEDWIRIKALAARIIVFPEAEIE